MKTDYFDDLGRLVGPVTEYRAAFLCNDCNAVWYGHEEMSPDGRHPPPDNYCPSCGGEDVDHTDALPGALVLKSWVEWPEDCPSMHEGDGPF
jgi:hypothetical protein